MVIALIYLLFACLSEAQEECDSQHFLPTCSGVCDCAQGLECNSGIEGDGYCYCSKENVVSVESFSSRTNYWRLDLTNQRVYLDQYNATKNLTDLTYYFTWCNKFSLIADLYSNDDHRAFQPSNYKAFHNYWLFYNHWHLSIKPDLSNNTDNSTRELALDASFVWEQNAWYDSTVAFRSKRYSGLYIIHQNGDLTFGHYDGSEKFKRDASFIVHQENPKQIFVEGSGRPPLSLYDILGISVGVLISFSLIVAGIVWVTRKLIERGRRESEKRKKLIWKNLHYIYE